MPKIAQHVCGRSKSRLQAPGLPAAFEAAQR